MNRVSLCGNLGKNPEIRHTQSGMAVCNFTLATQESRKNAKGEREKYAEWHNIVCWDRTAENVAKYLVKGSQCIVEGSLATRKWVDKEQVTRYTTEINASTVHFLGAKKSEDHSSEEPAFATEPAFAQATPSPDKNANPYEFVDSIPF